MHAFLRSRGVRAVTVPAATGLLIGVAAIASPAVASAGSGLTVAYPVHGSTHLKKPNTTVSLGPGTLKATLNLGTGVLSASLTLPAAKVSFSELGLIPVSATTEFVQDGPTTGKADPSTGAVTTTSKIVLKITRMSVGGLPVFVGRSCESAKPAVITVKSQRGFSVISGGKLAGTYTIPAFAHCGLAGALTPLINVSIAGPGNTINFTLGAGKAA